MAELKPIDMPYLGLPSEAKASQIYMTRQFAVARFIAEFELHPFEEMPILASELFQDLLNAKNRLSALIKQTEALVSEVRDAINSLEDDQQVPVTFLLLCDKLSQTEDLIDALLYREQQNNMELTDPWNDENDDYQEEPA
jgi:hypothetical protein